MSDKLYNSISGNWDKRKEEEFNKLKKDTYNVYIQFDEDEPLVAFPFIPLDEKISLDIYPDDEVLDGIHKNMVYFRDKESGKEFKIFIKLNNEDGN